MTTNRHTIYIFKLKNNTLVCKSVLVYDLFQELVYFTDSLTYKYKNK